MKTNYKLILLFAVLILLLGTIPTLLLGSMTFIDPLGYVYRQESDLLKLFFILLSLALEVRRLNQGYLVRLHLDGLSPCVQLFTLLKNILVFSLFLGGIWFMLGFSSVVISDTVLPRSMGVLTGLTQGAYTLTIQALLAMLMLVVAKVWLPKLNALLSLSGWFILHFFVLVIFNPFVDNTKEIYELRWLLGPVGIVMAYIGPTVTGVLVPFAQFVICSGLLYWNLRTQMIQK